MSCITYYIYVEWYISFHVSCVKCNLLQDTTTSWHHILWHMFYVERYMLHLSCFIFHIESRLPAQSHASHTTLYKPCGALRGHRAGHRRTMTQHVSALTHTLSTANHSKYKSIQLDLTLICDPRFQPHLLTHNLNLQLSMLQQSWIHHVTCVPLWNSKAPCFHTSWKHRWYHKHTQKT